MAYDFDGENWAAEIAAVSGDPEFQNCEIQIRNPNLMTVTPDILDGGVVIVGNPVVWQGRARVVGVRSALDISPGTSATPSGTKSVRVQIPYGTYVGRINRGWQIRVIDGGRNVNLERYVLFVESDFNSGNVASPVIECSIAIDEEANWGDVPAMAGLYPGPDTFPGPDTYPGYNA